MQKPKLDLLVNDNWELQKKYSAMREFDFPRIASLRINLYAASFQVMKLFPARAIVEQAALSGELKEGYEVIESTSGTFGLALALLSREFGYRLTLVSDPVIDDGLRQRFFDLGVKLEIVENRIDGGYQKARLAKVAELRAKNRWHYFTNQYHNPYNCIGYERLADYLSLKLGKIDCLVGTVGTGGSMCGTAKQLLKYNPNLKVIGVDTHRSVLFGQPNGSRALRGLGNSIMPDNVDHTLFDEIHWVSAGEAFLATRLLHRHQGLYMGGTSGAAYMVANWYAKNNPAERVACLFPDSGFRYQDTIYNDNWLEKLEGFKDELPEDPISLAHPSQLVKHWAHFNWDGRSLNEVMNCK